MLLGWRRGDGGACGARSTGEAGRFVWRSLPLWTGGTGVRYEGEWRVEWLVMKLEDRACPG